MQTCEQELFGLRPEFQMKHTNPFCRTVLGRAFVAKSAWHPHSRDWFSNLKRDILVTDDRLRHQSINTNRSKMSTFEPVVRIPDTELLLRAPERPGGNMEDMVQNSNG